MTDPRPEKIASPAESAHHDRRESSARIEQSQWRRPAGVAPGTWRYVQQGSIANHYDAFVAETPLCALDQTILRQLFESIDSGQQPVESTEGEATRTGQKVFSDRDNWVLDLGCGTGRAATELSRLGRNVLAIDLSQSMLNHVVERSKRSQVESTSQRTGSIVPLRANLVQLDCLADNSAAGAVCLFSTLGMIQGRENRRQVLRHASRIVRPGGKLLLHVHNRYASLAQSGGKRLLAKSLLKSIISRDHDFGDATYAYRGLPDMFLHRYSKRKLAADLQTTGWQNNRINRLTLDGSATLDGILANRVKIAGGYIVEASSGSQSKTFVEAIC
ncbi:class I SAM-dependent methyltransferase [Rhodopirellula baltica]|uniref:Protein containing Methyltransferase type 11 domain protein n=1 Tax=Rhodopirellula baltica SWK14 TaxID=993516 RepID=L7CAM3_RHOBT|nr:class I SAM-dependent methyltransferase [Rhodopirellula baltica]ELP31254.1 protein containing Methyltransferase type 11 domain protein [Rhodopirellula baltica SWK14]